MTHSKNQPGKVTRRGIYVTVETWDAASRRAKMSGHTVADVVCALLDAYAAGNLTAPVDANRTRGGRTQRPTRIPDDTWARADKRRKSVQRSKPGAHTASMAALVDALLHRYVGENMRARTVIEIPEDDVNEPHPEEDGSVTPSLFLSAA